jgi:hypothetical protein
MITGISAGAGGSTLLQLDRPLQWTHLGVVLPVPGDEYGRTVRGALCVLVPLP